MGVRRQSEYVPMTKEQFRKNLFARFYDPKFEAVSAELEKVFEIALSLTNMATLIRSGRYTAPDADLHDPREK